MSNLNLNTLTFDTERRTGSADQAVLMPTGSVPVIIVFGDSLTMGAESVYTNAQQYPQTRVYDEPYVGRQMGLHWNNWLETDDGIDFESRGSNGVLTSGGANVEFNGDAFEESVALCGGTTQQTLKPYLTLGTNGLVNPVWGLLREIYGLFRDEVTGEVILPRVIQVGRSNSYINVGSGAGSSPALSWQKDYEGQVYGTVDDQVKSCWDMLTDVIDAARTGLTGTDSYLVGVFTDAGYADTLNVVNTGATANEWDNMAQYVGPSLQKFREDLEAEYSLDQFPMIACTPRLVETKNTLTTAKAAGDTIRDWVDAYDMTEAVRLESLANLPGGFAGDDNTNPHADGFGSYYLGTLWGQALRKMYSDPNEMVTGPQFTS